MSNSNSSKQVLLSVIGIAIVIVTIVGVAFAFFNYTRTGTSNTIRVGRISFVSKNEETITLNNLFPIDPSNTSDMNDNTKVGTYSIDIKGDTDYVDGIEYLVSAVDANIYTSEGQIVPITLDFTVTDLGDPSANYFTERENTNASIYKKLVGDTLVGDQMLLVGFIKPNTTSGTAEGIDGSITIKAYLDKNKILISDTYDGTESDNMGTSNSLAQGKTVLTTAEWNALNSTGVSFKVKVEANEGIWVNGSLEEIMRKDAVMDNVASEHVSASTGIDFGSFSSSTNGQGVYMRTGTENDAYPIVYYRGAVEDNNVLFNNQCWKAVRTTDTGGVKLIYNGTPAEVFEKVSLSESEYAIVTNTANFAFDSSDNTWTRTITGSDGSSSSPLEISFTVPARNNYILQVSGVSSTTGMASFTIYKDGIGVNGSGNGGGAALNFSYTYGTLIADNVIKMTYFGNGTSESPTIIKVKMVYLNETMGYGCDNSGVDTHINISGTNMFAFNTSSNSPAYVGYMYGTVYSYSTSNWTSGARFGSSFTWNGTNYTLVDDSLTSPNATHHYSCNVTTENGTCTDLRYVYDVDSGTKYYITLTGGDGIEEALAKMQTNTNDSNAKDKIDTWYASNMNTVTSKLEDTIWCNDRSIGKYNGWSATGSWGTDWKDYSILYGAFERSDDASGTSTTKNQPSLACANKNDAFAVNNGNQKLQYPVALLTEDEIVLAGGLAGTINTSFYLYNGSIDYWSLSPSNFGAIATEFYVYDGRISDNLVSGTIGLRPSVSLKPGMPVVSGDGTTSSPYRIGE